MKVVLITNDSNESKALELLMIEQGINLTKVIKVIPSNDLTLANRIERLLKRVMQKVESVLKQDDRTKEILKFEHKCQNDAAELLNTFIKKKTQKLPMSPVESINVEHINSEHAVDELRKESPEVCVVWGVGIIKEKVLALADNFINAHASILPHFKGARSEFWQCFNKDLDSIEH